MLKKTVLCGALLFAIFAKFSQGDQKRTIKYVGHVEIKNANNGLNGNLEGKRPFERPIA